MRTRIFHAAFHLAVSACVAITFLLPGLLFHLLSDTQLVWFRGKYFLIFMAFGLVLAACRSFRVVAAVFVTFAVLEITQFSSLAYFGEYINPYAIGQMVVEFADVTEAARASFGHLYYVLLIVLIPYGLCLYLLHKTWTHLIKVHLMTVFVILFLLFPSIRIKTHSDRKDILKFFPIKHYPSLANTLNSYSLWLAVLVPQSFTDDSAFQFKPYIVQEKQNWELSQTVVLVMGESFTFNRMSLFGYQRPTTPFLDSLAHNPAFVYKKGFAAANATRSVMPMFYNIQYHPLNREVLKRQTTNMFRLAKDHGFQTVYISAQKSNCLNGVNTSSIDHFISYESAENVFDAHKDEGLLILLKNLKWSNRNFIVLHQRNAHAPYQTNYRHRPEVIKYPYGDLDFKQATANAYDNAVLYNDLLYRAIIDFFRSNLKAPIYLFFTSDHGEEFGEHGVYGHDHLTVGSASVPILFYGIEAQEQFVDRIRALHMPTHYEMGLLIADRLGYTITNPNEEKGFFYINGVASFGKSGYVRCRKGEGELPTVVKVFQ